VAVNGTALAAVAAGSVFTYAGLKGISIPAAVQYLVQGKNPSTLPNAYPVDAPVSVPNAPGPTTVGPGSATGQAIANASLKYKGTRYTWGGRADKPGNWDCSSFVFYVLAHDMGMTVLGKKWGDPGAPPNAHGPTAVQYRAMGRQVPYSQIQAGDLLVWSSHIGIAISSTQMMAARSTATGTGVSTIADSSRYHGGQPTVHRVGS